MASRIAVVGATGAVGREMLRTLVERDFAVREVVALAGARAVGQQISFGERTVLTVRNLESFDFAGWDIALFSAGAAVAAAQAPRAAAAGCLVIDDSGQFHMEPDVPLVVPEVNARALAKIRRGIVAAPSAVAVQLALALKPLHERFRVRRVVVSTYQSVSAAGKEGMDELFAQSKGSFVNDPPKVEVFVKPVAFNCLPQIDAFMDDGATREEWKLAVQLRKILDPDIRLVATCVVVPVFIGHAAAVTVECERAVGMGEARAALREAAGVVVLDDRREGGWITPLECQGEDAVYVSRIRRDSTVEHGLSFWCAADNLRRGAALNAVQIAEAVVAQKRIAADAAARG